MIEFKGVRKVYPGNAVAIKDANLTINDGEFVCFIGTSGSGKTTALRMINRMHDPSDGVIEIDGEATTSKEPVKLRRSIGYVIQRIGLMPHQTIYDNIITVPKLLGWDADKMRARAEELMERVELPLDFLDRYPNELSGGQQQRIGVIRALAANPKIVLMDEPFGALDPITRDALQELVKELQEEYHSTFVFVTHDMDEALKLSDRIAIWHDGELVQYDTPDEILRHPVNDYVRDFVGEERLSQAETAYITVKEVMNTKPLTIRADESIADAITVMRNNRVDGLYVVDDEKTLLGWIGLEAISATRDSSIKVEDIMQRKVRYVIEDALIQDTMHKILYGGKQNVPVINMQGHLTGIVTRSALVNIIYDKIWGVDDVIEQTDGLGKNAKPTPVQELPVTPEAEGAEV